MKWHLNKIQYPIYNLGPGKRLGIWVQGCDLGCKGCVNQTLWQREGGRSVEVIDVFNWILSLETKFDGITLSGGEPFEQYEPLIAFLHLLKKKTTLDAYCFTGYYLRELEVLYPDRLFYQYIDFLVDGRYVSDLHQDKNVKGSANQTLYKFDAGVAIAQEEIPSRKWSVQVSRDNQIYMSGIPRKNDLNQLCSDLARVGIRKEFR
jgi:anaerobic ribonucleoside-triphosphate reductase activating protein